MHYFWFLVTIGCAALAAAETTANRPSDPAKIEAFVERSIAARRGAIALREHTLRGLRTQKEKSEDVSRRIAKLENELRALKASSRPVLPTLIFPLSKGAIGRLPRGTCHVDQIISDSEMLVRCYFPVKVTAVRRFEPESETVMHEMTVLVRGLSARDAREGADLEVADALEVSGQEIYQTVDGRKNTVWALRRFDVAAAEPYFRRAQGAGSRP